MREPPGPRHRHSHTSAAYLHLRSRDDVDERIFEPSRVMGCEVAAVSEENRFLLPIENAIGRRLVYERLQTFVTHANHQPFHVIHYPRGTRERLFFVVCYQVHQRVVRAGARHEAHREDRRRFATVIPVH